VGLFIRDILSGKPVEVFGDCKRKKNVIYVKDLVKIIARMSQFEFNTFEAFNVAGTEVSLEALLKDLIAVIGMGEFRLKDFPNKIKNIDTGEIKFNGCKLNAKLAGFKYTEMPISLAKTVSYFRKIQRWSRMP
jgi:nucleoside-diphosphate-sugar epimerase